MVDAAAANGDGQRSTPRGAATPTVLKALAREHNWHTYPTFKRAYEKAAKRVGSELVRSYPSERTFKRWISGRTELPGAERCAVLEAMFPGWSAAELFEPFRPADDDPDQILLKVLLKQQRLHTYRAFRDAYDEAARKIDSTQVGGYPSERQFYRWISGDMIGLPYAENCAILEAMLPGYTAAQLFESASKQPEECGESPSSPFRRVDSPAHVTGKAELMDPTSHFDRRTVMRAGIATGVILGVGKSGGSRSVDPAIVKHLTTLREALVSSDSLLGPGRLIESANEQARNIPELTERAKGNLRGRLFELGSLFAEFSGWLADDVGDIQAGRSWSSLALEWAEASGNENLAAYVLMRMSQQAQLADDRAIVGPLADAALRRGGAGAVTVQVQAAAAQQAAFGHALDGDVSAALASIERARGLVEGDEGSAADPYELAGYCTSVYLSAQHGMILTELGRHEQALDAYADALRAWPDEYRRERGLHLARQTLTAAVAGKADYAVSAATEALVIADETGSQRTLDVLRSAARKMTEFSGSREVRELCAALEERERENGISAHRG